MNSLESEFSTSKVTPQSVNEQIKLATEPILRQVEKLCASFESGNELETAGNGETTSLRTRPQA